MFLYPNGSLMSYMYPTRPDILQVPGQGVLMKIELWTAAGIIYTLRAEEIDKSDKKHAFFHK
jgi:hypothetical protein